MRKFARSSAVADPYGQANRKHLAPLACSHNREGKTVTRTGLFVESEETPRCRSIESEPQDFDEVKRDYCRKHGIKLVELCARLEGNNQLAAELYALAQGRARKVAPKGVKVGQVAARLG